MGGRQKAVDRNLPGVTLDQLAGAQKASIETSKRFTGDDHYAAIASVGGPPQGNLRKGT